MSQQYDILFSGEVLDGQDASEVRQRLGRLFKASDAALDRLFSGKPVVVKRNCDKAEALKYRRAMEQAGARPQVRIAAETATQPGAAEAPGDQPSPSSQPEQTGSGLTLAAPGAEVLTEEERAPVQTATIDTSHLEVVATGNLSESSDEAPATTPDTSHLTLAAAGETIPTLPAQAPGAPPETDHLELAEVGADLTDPAPPEPAPALELDDLELAPVGSDVLEERYRQHETPPPPATDHLSLEDS